MWIFQGASPGCAACPVHGTQELGRFRSDFQSVILRRVVDTCSCDKRQTMRNKMLRYVETLAYLSILMTTLKISMTTNYSDGQWSSQGGTWSRALASTWESVRNAVLEPPRLGPGHREARSSSRNPVPGQIVADLFCRVRSPMFEASWITWSVWQLLSSAAVA